jgi:hypothetical protein
MGQCHCYEFEARFQVATGDKALLRKRIGCKQVSVRTSGRLMEPAYFQPQFHASWMVPI